MVSVILLVVRATLLALPPGGYTLRGRACHTLILRDVNDRLEAQRTIQSLAAQADYLKGELRDLQTISFVVTAAETGHLVFGTVHTVSADTTVDRMINSFPGKQQD